MNQDSKPADAMPPPPAERREPDPGNAIFRAPNGLEIAHYSLAETAYVYHEIFEDRVYFRHGISLEPGESVFDIGANIGLFSIFLRENFPDTRVYAFEPSPAIFPLLKANLARYGESVRLYPCGMADCRRQATFTFYPNYSIISGFHAQAGHDQATLRAGFKSDLIAKGADPARIKDEVLDWMVRAALEEKREYVCELRSISEIMNEAAISRVGLVKIDAEGAELQILAGIRDEHWPRIRQIVMEIHDPGAARSEVQKMLEIRGYVCVFEKESRLSETGIINCYAQRI